MTLIMFAGLTTPGSRSSEFFVTVLNAIVQLILALTDVISSGTATRLGVFGTIAYVLSRGLAKYETRTVVTAPGQPVAPAAPAPPQVP